MLTSVAFADEGRAGLKDAGWWQAVGESWGGGKSAAGVVVSKREAIGYAAVWRAVSLIAGDVGKVPMMVYRRTDDGKGKTRANDHAAYRLMRWKPNAEHTAQSFRELLQADVLLHGNAYAFIERLGDGTPNELRWLDPTRTYPERKGGQLRYITRDEKGQTQPPIPPENMFHLRGLGDDGLAGYSVLSVARETIGLGVAARDYGSRFFGNNSISPLVFETDRGAMATDKQREDLRRDWERGQGGDNIHRTAVLPPGVHPKPIGIPAQDAQLVETQELTLRQLANFFGVPPHKIGDTTRTSYASLEQENQAYLGESLDRWLCKWEFEAWAKLLTIPQQQRDTHFFEFERKALLRTDSRTRAAYNRTALGGAPWETVNEVRAKENLDPIDDPKADELQWPMNMGDNPDAGKQDDPANDGDAEPDAAPDEPTDDVSRSMQSARTGPPDPGCGTYSEHTSYEVSARTLSSNAVRAILVRDCGRVASRIAIAANKVATKKPKGYWDWVRGMADEHRSTVDQMVADAVSLASELSGRQVIDPADVLLGKATELLSRAGNASVESLPHTVPLACNDFAAWARQWAEDLTK